MNISGQTICLSMIVKNEAHVIRRCLDSVRPIIDHWVIVDTGSTDGTQDVIRSAMADLPGRLIERPWVDFAHNRSEALALARPHSSYTLIIDADDELIIPAGFTMPKLDVPGYVFTISDRHTEYTRIQLVSNTLTWCYRGVLHEFIDSRDKYWTKPMPLVMRRGEDGARHRDESTYRQDAGILEKALTTERDPFLIARYTFYLAQSYRDCGELRKAIENYSRRSELGNWREEVYISLLSAAQLKGFLGDPEDEVRAIFDRAIPVCPERAEARHGASVFFRQRGQHAEAFLYAQEALHLTAPNEALFLQNWIYLYGLRDEYAVAAFNTGQYRACFSTCLDILGQADIPPDVRTRIAGLARQALAKMVDPAWGCRQSPYSAEFWPCWEFSAA
ncbi:glycosyltransferase [Methylobacterium sp. PvR107]|uniref:glycosyltransferase n=1 Tax=Methylobacterium sp. PvR107 TaxID=2806597 RepID=UPI001AE334F5|nr:glycosyltransferase [Methylobacterium sp. PvR107]MBP1182848.1 tetratricopeptide (TPR) repeat protein [Methylobacterium sp. PvR107]